MQRSAMNRHRPLVKDVEVGKVGGKKKIIGRHR